MAYERTKQKSQEFASEQEYLSYCLELGKKYKNPPKVKLELITYKADGTAIGGTDIVATTSIQCYSAGTAVMKERRSEKEVGIVKSTADAGHHTTRMHQHLTWVIEDASRSAVHDAFHSHPFYDSEQKSQRYVEAKRGKYLMPAELTPEQEEIYLKAADYANEQYFVLEKLLAGDIDNRMHRMYPEKGWNVAETRKRLEEKSKKLCQEVARYVLPIGQQTTFDHTLNTLELLRLFRASQMSNFSDEARYLVARMVETAAEADPTILSELRKPVSVPVREIKAEYVTKGKREFDARLGGKESRYISEGGNKKEILANAVRGVLGLSSEEMSNDEAIMELVNPKFNVLLADVWETGIQDPLTSCLRQVSATFETKLSHAADSQRQRHRRTPGTCPPIEATYDGTADYATPMVIKESPELLCKYNEIMEEVYKNIEKCIEAGIPKADALLLLPNAHNLRISETGDLFDWLHRFKQRLCMLAQEEIFFISVEQVEQLIQETPELEMMFLAPCGIRLQAGVSPRCPEGARWCGQPVFGWKIDKYAENRVV